MRLKFKVSKVLTNDIKSYILEVSNVTNVRNDTKRRMLEMKLKHGMKKVYGYARVSTSKQNIERQVRNIESAYGDVIIFKESFTGTKLQGRTEFQKLLKVVKEGDTIIFDSVSRMSRNAEEGIQLYEELMEKGIELVFLKEPYINTETYKNSLGDKIQLMGTDEDILFKAINEYMKKIARKQIEIAFQQAEKEVKDLSQRTKEGMITAKANGKQIGQIQGTKLVTKKSLEKKEQIKKYCKDFGGSLNDKDTMKLIGIARNTYYKYKKELMEEV